MQINLDDFIPGSVHFRWRESLWLPTWGIYCFPTPEQEKNIIKVAQKMDYIRNRFNKPITITSWLRPSKYNEWKYPYGVSGAKASAHCEGKAVDFKILTIPCDEVRLDLSRQLEHLVIRMERADGQDRVHIDIRSVVLDGNRYFYPPGSLFG